MGRATPLQPTTLSVRACDVVDGGYLVSIVRDVRKAHGMREDVINAVAHLSSGDEPLIVGDAIFMDHVSRVTMPVMSLVPHVTPSIIAGATVTVSVHCPDKLTACIIRLALQPLAV